MNGKKAKKLRKIIYSGADQRSREVRHLGIDPCGTVLNMGRRKIYQAAKGL